MLSSHSCNHFKETLDQTYVHIINSIVFASDRVLSRTKFRPYLKPYWDSTLKDLHAIIRDKRRTWVRAGRPRGQTHPSYREYKSVSCAS